MTEQTKLRTINVKLVRNGLEETQTFTDVIEAKFFNEAPKGTLYHQIKTMTTSHAIVETDNIRIQEVTSTDQEFPIGSLAGVEAEMKRQVAKWGQQNHYSYTINTVMNEVEISADAAKARCDEKAKKGLVSWTDIFLEEVFEAFDEAKKGNLENLRTELVQCAAVAVSWIESIDRNKK